jgi:hypothetical protein
MELSAFHLIQNQSITANVPCLNQTTLAICYICTISTDSQHFSALPLFVLRGIVDAPIGEQSND